MKVQYNAGNFQIETYTNGHPMWITIKHNGSGELYQFHHNELSDLSYIVERMKDTVREKLTK